MNVLGISCYYHDSGAALVCDGKLIAAAEEERFTRKKHDNSFPARTIEYCLREAGMEIGLSPAEEVTKFTAEWRRLGTPKTLRPNG